MGHLGEVFRETRRSYAKKWVVTAVRKGGESQRGNGYAFVEARREHKDRQAFDRKTAGEAWEEPGPYSARP